MTPSSSPTRKTIPLEGVPASEEPIPEAGGVTASPAEEAAVEDAPRPSDTLEGSSLEEGSSEGDAPSATLLEEKIAEAVLERMIEDEELAEL
jgi:hypothetical protein